MLSKKAIKALASKLKIDATELQTAIDAPEEKDITIPEVEVFTADELKIRDTSKYTEGKTAGTEIAVKEAVKAYKKENNLDFQGNKIEDLVKTVSAKTDQTDTINNLRKNITDLERERDAAKTQASQVMLQSKIHAAIPETNNGMSKAEVEAVMKANGYDFKEENGKIVTYRNGEKVKDAKLQTEVEHTEAIKGFVTEKKWIGESDPNRKGRGGDNSDTKSKPTYSKASEVLKDFEDKHGKGSAMGTEHDYGGHLAKIMKEMDDAGTPLILD